MFAYQVSEVSGIEGLQLHERAIPGPLSPTQVLVRITAVALNYRDLLVVEGQGRWKPPAGRIPCSDACGVVEEVGAAVMDINVGDRVISTILPRWIDGPSSAAKLVGSLGGAGADGVLTQLAVLEAKSILLAPPALTDAEASSLPCAALTAWQALTRAASLAPGKCVLLQGTGGVSIFALQIAVAAGATVAITSSNDRKLKRALAMGAACGVNYRTSSDWVAEALRFTNDDGFDHVLDIGGQSTLKDSVRLAAFEGCVSVIGLIGGLETTLDITPIFLKNLRIDGIETGSRAMLADLIAFIAEKRLSPVIDKEFPFSEARAALKYLKSGSHFGKIVISVDPQAS